MKRRPNPRIMPNPRVVVFQPVLRTQGGYIGVKGLRAAIVGPTAFLGACSAAGATCVTSVLAAPMHLFPPGKPKPCPLVSCQAPTPLWGGALLLCSCITGASRHMAHVWDWMSLCFILNNCSDYYRAEGVDKIF